jgi:hypothetical protein
MATACTAKSVPQTQARKHPSAPAFMPDIFLRGADGSNPTTMK